MTNENPETHEQFSVWTEDGTYIIDHHGGPTTQGDSLIEALMMMADALRQDRHDDQTMMKMAADTFIIDPEDERFLKEELQ